MSPGRAPTDAIDAVDAIDAIDAIDAPGAAAGTAFRGRPMGLSEGTDRTRPHAIMLGGP